MDKEIKDRAILVVDDDPFICRVIASQLEAEGHRPTAVSDSQKALEFFAANAVDLVVTDYDMPVMTGGQLARRIRTLRPSTPICLVTGSAEDADSSDFEVFDGVLSKPFERTQLTSMVAAALAGMRATGLVQRPPRYEVDWRVDCIPLEAASLARMKIAPRRAALLNVSEFGLAFVADETPDNDQRCAFLIYPPASGTPALMVGEVRWTRNQSGKKLSGTKSLFWGSEREKALVIEQAM